MGVPGFYSWLFKKFGDELKEFLENEQVFAGSDNIEGGTFDNLYIDMNGLIHPCCHPEEGRLPKDEDDMLINILSQMERITGTIRPKKLLFLSIDGCAPRAKMNQQRSRRFKSVISKDNNEFLKTEILESFKDVFEDNEDNYKEFLVTIKKWDHNVITPGTPFMEKVISTVYYFCYYKLNTDPSWKDLVILVSDHSVPGEGEQKIYNLIRKMRQDPKYNPLTTHVIHGLDADLVMLSLLTHEPNFFILREDVFDRSKTSLEKPLHLVNVRRIRERLKHRLKQQEGSMLHLFDFQNVLNDFVFLLYFCGNDFLPNLPGLGIDHNGIDKIVSYYNSFLSKTKKYLTSNGEVNVTVLIQFINLMIVPNEMESMKQNFKYSSRDALKVSSKVNYRKPLNTIPRQFKSESKWLKSGNISSLKTILSSSVKKKSLSFPQPRNLKLSSDIIQCKKGWRNKYIAYKVFLGNSNHTDEELLKVRHDMALSYLKGMVWVWKYYTDENPSWDWYYEYHYPPFAEDFNLLTKEELKEVSNFTKGNAYKPFEQLMAVLPEKSNHCLPDVYKNLLNEKSEIGDFYPNNFTMDLNYHKKSFKAHALIPFIDMNRLLSKIKPLENKLSKDETIRNSFGNEVLFATTSNTKLFSFYQRLLSQNSSEKVVNSNFIGNNKDNYFYVENNVMCGYMYLIDRKNNLKLNKLADINSVYKSPIVGKEDLLNKNVITTVFFPPSFRVTKFGDLVDFSTVKIKLLPMLKSRNRRKYTSNNRYNNNYGNNNYGRNRGNGNYGGNRGYGGGNRGYGGKFRNNNNNKKWVNRDERRGSNERRGFGSENRRNTRWLDDNKRKNRNRRQKMTMQKDDYYESNNNRTKNLNQSFIMDVRDSYQSQQRQMNQVNIQQHQQIQPPVMITPVIQPPTMNNNWLQQQQHQQQQQMIQPIQQPMQVDNDEGEKDFFTIQKELLRKQEMEEQSNKLMNRNVQKKMRRDIPNPYSMSGMGKGIPNPFGFGVSEDRRIRERDQDENVSMLGKRKLDYFLNDQNEIRERTGQEGDESKEPQEKKVKRE